MVVASCVSARMFAFGLIHIAEPQNCTRVFWWKRARARCRQTKAKPNAMQNTGDS